MNTLLPVYTIGFIALLQLVSLDYTKVNDPAVRGASLLPRNKSYTKSYCTHHENSDTLRTFGTGHCFPITLKNSILCAYGSDNARTFSIILASVYRDLAKKRDKANPAQQEAFKKNSKNG